MEFNAFMTGPPGALINGIRPRPGKHAVEQRPDKGQRSIEGAFVSERRPEQA